MDHLTFGYGDAVPDTAVGAWGARAIVNQDGLVDLVPGRDDVVGDTRILQVLTEEVPLKGLVKLISDLLKDYVMKTREDEPFVLAQSDVCVVVANTKASAGYVYIAGWCTE